MTAKHAKLSPSGSSRWMPCSGSIALCNKVPKAKSSSYADEGTAAHDLAAKCLLEKKAACEYIGTIINVEKSANEFVPFKVTDEMAEAVQVYLDVVRRDQSFYRKTEMKIENRFSLTWLWKDMFGSNDCSLFAKEEKHLCVYDYKHGKGVVVDVEWNSQLLIYALGALYEAWDIENMLDVTHTVKTVDIVIVQPRIEHPLGYERRWSISTEDLLYWGMHVLRAAAKATEDPTATLVAGKHCRFCDALAICPEQAKQAAKLAKTEFAKPVLPAPEDLTPEDIVEIMEKATLFDKWLEQIKAYAFNQLQMGVAIPGHKLVQKKSNRVWTHEATAEKALLALLDRDAYEEKLLSVAKAEKALKVRGISAEANLGGLWHKPEAGVTMALMSDKRKEIAPAAITDFAGIDQDDPEFLR